MGAHFDFVAFGEEDSLTDDRRITAMKAAGNVRTVNERHDLFIAAHGIGTKTFAQITVQFDVWLVGLFFSAAPYNAFYSFHSTASPVLSLSDTSM